MKNFKITFLAILFIGTVSFGQTLPKTPTTPKTGDMHTDVTSTVSNSTSISNANEVYILTSKFQKSKKAGILSILKDELDNIKLLKSRNNFIWKKVEKGTTVFECKLSARNLKITLNKDDASRSFIGKIESLGDDLVEFISAHKSFETVSKTSISAAQLRLERAKEELKRSIQQLEKAKENRKN
jgi:hypothetical protein